MSTRKKCDIFISYRRDGGDMTAMYIYQALKERRYDVFYDLEVLRAGKFNDSLLEYIHSCQDFVLVLSPHCLDRCVNEDDWVRKEIAEALRLKKNIIPVMLKGFQFPDTLPEDIDDVRYQNGLTTTTEYFQESMNRLCTKYMQSKPKKKTALLAGGAAALAAVALTAALGSGLLPVGRPGPEPTPAVTAAPEITATPEATAAPLITATPEATAAPEITSAPEEIRPVSNTDWPVMRHDSPWALYDGQYACDTPENSLYGVGEAVNMPVFRNEALRRGDVCSVTFLNTLSGVGEDAWDISEAQNGSVLAWTQKNGELYDLYIAGEGGVRAPEDCPGLFCMYKNAAEIRLNGCFDTSENWNFDSFFEGCSSLKTLDVRTLDTSSATNMAHFFMGCDRLSGIDVSGFNTARVSNMDSMFAIMNSLRTLDISSFETSRVTAMASMFEDNYRVRELILGDGFDTSRVRTMANMFRGNSALLKLDVSKLKTGSAERMDAMFEGCRSLLELDVSGFDTSRVQKMEAMFANCEMLDGLDLGNWSTDQVRNMRSIFSGCHSLNDIGTQEGPLYEQLEVSKYLIVSRPDLYQSAETDHTISVIWKQGEDPINCAFAYDERSGHSYAFITCPSTAAYWGNADSHLVTVNTEEELAFLAQWAQRDHLCFGQTWIFGFCDPVAVYGGDSDLRAVWNNTWAYEFDGGVERNPYFAWEDGQPDGSGHWLQLSHHEKDGHVELYMDDLNDDARRPFILEFDRPLQDGEVLDLSWSATGGDEAHGYGEEFLFEDGSVGRLSESGVLTVSGSGATSITPHVWYSLYIREAIVKEGMKEIGFHTFDGCRNLTSVSLPESLETIGGAAFASTGLTAIEIPSGVTRIHPDAFDSIAHQLTIIAQSGSYAEQFAKEHGIRFQAK